MIQKTKTNKTVTFLTQLNKIFTFVLFYILKVPCEMNWPFPLVKLKKIASLIKFNGQILRTVDVTTARRKSKSTVICNMYRGSLVVAVLQSKVVGLQEVELFAGLLEQNPPTGLALKIIKLYNQ